MKSQPILRSIAWTSGALVCLAASCIGSPYPSVLWLQHTPTVLALLVLAVVVGRGWLGTASLVCCYLFLVLHMVAARWIYSFVPYDDWATAVFGQSASDYFGWQRNHFDRLVHLASGLLFVCPISEVLQRYAGARPLAAAFQSVSMVLAIGAIYEIVEWQLALTMSPAAAEAYNGQQGDAWDPQADMALAGLGAAVVAWLIRKHRFGGPDD